jgi:uncharacterized protein (TIGR02246 family)
MQVSLLEEELMPAAREAILEAYEALKDAFFRGDAESLTQIYADDAEWLVPGAPPIRGRAAITEAWKGVLGTGGNRVRVDVGEVRETGDWAYEVGGFATTAPGGATLNAGKYIVIWKRQPSGAWKTYRDIFHWDVAPVETPT